MPIITITMDQIMDQVGGLAPVSRVMQRALQIINNPKSNMTELAKVIKLDQAMTSLILRWVNSGYYSLTKAIGTIEQAVAYLGFKTVQDLVMTASVSGMMNRQVAGYSLEKGDLWKHSIGTAAGAQLLIKEIAPDQADEAYYCGLFCDVGKLAFDRLMQTTIPRVKLQDASNYSFDQVEKGLFGYSHAEVGAALVRRWNFPEQFAHVIEFHHSPGQLEPPTKTIGYAVHVADAVMSMFGVGIGRDSMQYVIDPASLDVLKWKEGSFEYFYNRIIPLVTEAEIFLHQPHH
jgi:putative nucleotidyltransferase with HDIG domain